VRVDSLDVFDMVHLHSLIAIAICTALTHTIHGRYTPIHYGEGIFWDDGPEEFPWGSCEIRSFEIEGNGLTVFTSDFKSNFLSIFLHNLGTGELFLLTYSFNQALSEDSMYSAE
jgi:hypothetical protein